MENDFKRAGADATVTLGNPNLLTRFAAWVKGDTVNEVRLLNRGPAKDERAGVAGRTTSPSESEVFITMLPLDNPSTNHDERAVAAANVTSHELGEQLGVPTADNHNSPPDIMTTDISRSDVSADLDFNQQDAKYLQKVTQ